MLGIFIIGIVMIVGIGVFLMEDNDFTLLAEEEMNSEVGEKEKILKEILNYLVCEHTHYKNDEEHLWMFEDEMPYINSLEFEKFIKKLLSDKKF